MFHRPSTHQDRVMAAPILGSPSLRADPVEGSIVQDGLAGWPVPIVAMSTESAHTAFLPPLPDSILLEMSLVPLFRIVPMRQLV